MNQLNFKNKLKSWRTRLSFQSKSKHGPRQKSGFTLIELIVSSLLISVVILVAWSGLISLMNMTAIAEAKSSRQAEVNQALDFVTKELRTAKYVNANGTNEVGVTVMDGGDAMDIADLLTSEGFDLNRLGNYGDLALALEVPAQETPPAICPAGGPNAGEAPPSPSEYDQIVYDVRTSPTQWLGPRVLMRYGRVPINGAFNPCDTPISSDPMADALADNAALTDDTAISCPGVLTGGAGFYACKQGETTQVVFQNTLVDNAAQKTSSVVTPRVQSIQPQKIAAVGCAEEQNLHQLNFENGTMLNFDNQSGQTVRLYSLNPSGERQFISQLGADTSTDLFSYMTQPWVVTDWDETCLAVFFPSENTEDNIAVIK